MCLSYEIKTYYYYYLLNTFCVGEKFHRHFAFYKQLKSVGGNFLRHFALSSNMSMEFSSTVWIRQLCSHLTFFTRKLSFSAKLYPFKGFYFKDIRMISRVRQICNFVVKL